MRVSTVLWVLIFLVLMAIVAFGSPAYAQDVLSDNPQGTVFVLGNEVSIVSKYDDPGKVRLAAEPGSLSLGALSFNRVFFGIQREMALFQGKQDETVRDEPFNPRAEFTWHLNDGSGYDDSAMKNVFQLRSDTVGFFLDTGGPLFTRDDLIRLKILLNQMQAMQRIRWIR